MDELSAQHVTIQDCFWNPRLEVNSSRAILHQWEQLEASGCINNFRIASGEQQGFREGFFFADSDAYKWLEAAVRAYAFKPDSALKSLFDSFIALVGRAQQSDGYLFTYNQVHFPGVRWINLMIEHELYCHGHLIEAGVSHYQLTGETKLLEIARKAADRIVTDFSGKGPAYTSGHEEIEIALLRLYEVTGHPPYLEITRQLIEQRGRLPFPSFTLSIIRQLRSVASRLADVRRQRSQYQAVHPGFKPYQLPPGNVARAPASSYLRWLASELSGKYLQQHTPIRKQLIPVGHAVRFAYLQTAAAMLQRVEPEVNLLPTMEQAWDRMVARRMYLTGGIGSVPRLEGFGKDDELNPEYAYAETCAALACMFWNWEMVLLTHKARYSDLFEWQLYNAASVGMGLGGNLYLYNNPLACKGGVRRKKWYSCPCCPSNLSRTWANLGKYIFSSDNRAIWIHQYIGSKATLMTEVPVNIEVESGLPWIGKLRIDINPHRPSQFKLYLRKPSWSVINGDALVIRINGEIIAPEIEAKQAGYSISMPEAGGYDPRESTFLKIERLWSPGDTLELDFPMAITLRRLHERVRGSHGKVAVTRGPLVYCLESIDNPAVDIFSARLAGDSLFPEIASDLLGGITLLRGKTPEGRPLTFIPYQLWANRGESQMTVWVNS